VKLIQKTCMLLVALALPGVMQAGELPNNESMQGFQFNFSPPGARSLGMGGAFLGRADDSTAAFANPAGLTNLFSAELAAEFRFNDYSTPYSSGGTFPDVTRASANSSANNLSYLSYVYPTERWVFAAFRQEFMDFNSRFDTGEIILGGTGIPTFPTNNSVDINIVNYGFSTAFRVNDRLSLGVSISYMDYSLDASTLRLSRTTGAPVNQQVQTGNDTGYGITAGALFRASERFSVGFVYRSTPKFNTDHRHENFANSALSFSRQFNFELPDVYGVGLSFQPNDNLTINFDVIRINYSDLASPVFWAFGTTPSAPQQASIDRMSIGNGTEFRLGAEYVMKNKPIVLRGGVWQDPSHSLTYNGTPDASDPNQIVSAAFFPGGSDQTHYSVGFGFFFSNFQMDFAADFSDNQDTISVSGVYRFN